MRLQKEANLRIAELSEKAHWEAVRYLSLSLSLSDSLTLTYTLLSRNLGEHTRDVYHENVCMSEALALHSARVEQLELRTQQLEEVNRYTLP